MSFEPSEQAGKQKAGSVAIWVGLILICVAIARMLILPALIDDKSSEPLQPKVTEVPAVIEPPIVDTDVSQPQQSALLETTVEDTNLSSANEAAPDEPILTRSESVAISAEPLQAPVLQTYYAEVRGMDGKTQTLTFSANNEEKARTIIRDFRGDPKILNGPSLEITW